MNARQTSMRTTRAFWKKYPKPLSRQAAVQRLSLIHIFAALALAFLLLLYVGYQGYMATHQSLKTETAMYGQVSDVLQVDGFVIRNETVVEDSYNGCLLYTSRCV